MFFCWLFVSCENDLEQVKTVTATDDTPDEIVNNMHTIYSDSGIVKFEIIATRMEKFSGEKELTIFKDGFEVNFFKGKDIIEAKLTAEYGEMRPNEKLIIARNNVIFTNFVEDQTLMTEELTWRQATKKIVTDKQFQIINRKDKMKVFGVGMEADETFSDYEMRQVTIEKVLEDK
ncbi:MAG: LPS export ABC transporter periplasmic protein LptC [Crocinitomicaceae bacterium]|nr:LPS export ABC transporter periplasmic protein LptC [Crocinitomicaceae bacterium]